jgi:3-methyladenine DNA glycosylase/8-oxoguanine DNA glycosylase
MRHAPRVERLPGCDQDLRLVSEETLRVDPDEERWLDFEEPLDLVRTARPLESGFGDPTQRLARNAWLRATRTAAGPATLLVQRSAGGVRLRAWGAGAAAALDQAPELLGLERPPPASEELSPPLRRLAHAARGLRLPRTAGWFEPLVLLVLQQKVSGKEAARTFRALVRAASEPAPGPLPGLWLPPAPERVARLPDWAFAPLGVGARPGATLRELARSATRIESLRAAPLVSAARRLSSVPGLGPWSVSSLLLRAAGAPDVVPLGDLHLPSLVAWTLAGERRADDARMLELLAPSAGVRGWVVRFIQCAGHGPPRRHPRRPLRPLPPGHDRALFALRRHLDG